MNNQIIKPLVAIIMGSQSDWDTMKFSEEILIKLEIPFITKIISAHRTPDRMNDFAKKAQENLIQVVIAGAGGAAHLFHRPDRLLLLPLHATRRPDQRLERSRARRHQPGLLHGRLHLHAGAADGPWQVGLLGDQDGRPARRRPVDDYRHQGHR